MYIRGGRGVSPPGQVCRLTLIAGVSRCIYTQVDDVRRGRRRPASTTDSSSLKVYRYTGVQVYTGIYRYAALQ